MFFSPHCLHLPPTHLSTQQATPICDFPRLADGLGGVRHILRRPCLRQIPQRDRRDFKKLLCVSSSLLRLSRLLKYFLFFFFFSPPLPSFLESHLRFVFSSIFRSIFQNVHLLVQLSKTKTFPLQINTGDRRVSFFFFF